MKKPATRITTLLFSKSGKGSYMQCSVDRDVHNRSLMTLLGAKGVRVGQAWVVNLLCSKSKAKWPNMKKPNNCAFFPKKVFPDRSSYIEQLLPQVWSRWESLTEGGESHTPHSTPSLLSSKSQSPSQPALQLLPQYLSVFFLRLGQLPPIYVTQVPVFFYLYKIQTKGRK